MNISYVLFPASHIIIFFYPEDLLAMYISAIIIGYIAGVVESASQVYFSTSPNQRVQIFSFRYYVVNLGAVIGPVIGIFTFDKSNNIIDVLLVSVIFASSFLLFRALDGIRIIESEFQPKDNNDHCITDILSKHRRFFLLILLFSLVLFGYSQIVTNYGDYYIENLSLKVNSIGYFVSAHALIILICSPFLLKKVADDNSSLWYLVGGGFICAALIMPALGFYLGISLLTQVILILFLYTIGEVFLFPISNSLILKSRDSMKPELAAAFFNLTRLGLLFGPIVGVYFIDYIGFYLFSTFVSAISIFGIVGLERRSR